MKEIILFDIGNVLLKPIHGEIIDILYKNKKNNIDIKEYKNKVALILNKSFEGKITLEQTWEDLFKIVNIEENQEAIKNKFKIIRNDELIRFIVDDLSKKYNIGILSDLSQIGYWTVNNYYNDLYEVCDKDKIFISINTGRTKLKNGKSYFNYIIEQLNVNPEMITFIDDEIDNINNAKELHINAVLFKNNGDWKKANEDIKMYFKGKEK